MDECCGTCRFGNYDPMQGYVCVNADSEYVADFVEYEHSCDEYEEKGVSMTENEALELMKSLQISKDCELVKTFDFKATVIKALENLHQYRAIGTIEEFKALKDKSEPKSRIIKNGKYYCCSCGRFAKTSGNCSHCGQMLY